MPGDHLVLKLDSVGGVNTAADVVNQLRAVREDWTKRDDPLGELEALRKGQ